MSDEKDPKDTEGRMARIAREDDDAEGHIAKVPGAAGVPGIAKVPGAAGVPGIAKVPGADDDTEGHIAGVPGIAKVPGIAGVPGIAKIPGADDDDTEGHIAKV